MQLVGVSQKCFFDLEGGVLGVWELVATMVGGTAAMRMQTFGDAAGCRCSRRLLLILVLKQASLQIFTSHSSKQQRT